MNDKLDVFEILEAVNRESENKGQEQARVPDPDFNEAIRQLDARYAEKINVRPDRTDNSESTSKNSKADKSKKSGVKRYDRRTGRKQNTADRKNTKPVKKMVVLMIILAFILIFFTFILNVPKVVGSSMEPALKNGDRVVINLLAGSYEVGDIVVFKTDSGEKLIKRIIAVSGDSVNITPDEGLLINGRVKEEDYIYTDTNITDITVMYPIIVNEDTYFVMGDNRSNSKDSRDSDIGLVDKEDIIGKVVFCWRKY